MRKNKKEIFIGDGMKSFYIISWRFYLFVAFLLALFIFIIKFPEKYNYDENIENIGYLIFSIFFLLFPFTGFWKMIAWGILETKSREGGIKEFVNEEQKEYLAPKIALFFELITFFGGAMMFIGMLIVILF